MILEDLNDGMKVVAKRVKEGHLFHFIADFRNHANTATSIEDEESLWNKHLGHVSYDVLSALQQNSTVTGLPPHLWFAGKGHACTSCQLGKQSRIKFHESTTG